MATAVADQTLFTLRMSQAVAEALGQAEIGSLVGQWLDVQWGDHMARAKVASVRLSGEEVAVTLAVQEKPPMGGELGAYSIAEATSE